MNRSILTLLVLGLATAIWAAPRPQDPPVGRIDYIEGGVSVVRDGKTLEHPDIDDPLLSGDFIKTDADGLLVVSLDKSTGMSGSLTLRARTALYLKLETVKGEKRTSLDLVAGSIASKVHKLAGTPTMQVSMGETVMGIRGTEYEVAVSVGDAVLVTCAEGEVAVRAGSDELPVPAGKALEKRPGERLRYLPVAVSSIRQFREQWMAEEIAVFRADPLHVLADYERRYTDLERRFSEAFEKLQKNEVLKKWMREDSSEIQPDRLDPENLREKKEIVGQLLELRKILFIFERIYYRLDEVSELLTGSAYERQDIRAGLSVASFLRRFRDERESLARRVAIFRYAEKLYELRNPGGAGMPGQGGGTELSGDDADFFGDDDF